MNTFVDTIDRNRRRFKTVQRSPRSSHFTTITGTGKIMRRLTVVKSYYRGRN